MPEGDIVWATCRRLHRALAGKVLTRCEFRAPQLATTDLTGVEVLQARPRGKHLLIRLGNGYTLHSHLRMDGVWRILPADWRPAGPPAHEVRVILGVADGVAAGYRLPVLELIMTARESEVVGHLGPDLLGPDWDVAEAVRRLLRQPERSIGEALLDQRNLAGIGTVYRAEILFLQGIHPRTPVGRVNGLDRVCRRVQTLMAGNLGGFEQDTVSDRTNPSDRATMPDRTVRVDRTTTSDRRPGRTHWVYGRGGQPCRRCGTVIKVEEFGPVGQERLSYWCPYCQPLR